MDDFSSSEDASSNIVIKNELDIDYEDNDDVFGEESEEMKIKQEPHSDHDNVFSEGSEKIKIKKEPLSDTECDNSNLKDEDNFIIDDYEKHCCVWVKEKQIPQLLQEPSISSVSHPEGTVIVRVNPVNNTRPLRIKNNVKSKKENSGPEKTIKRMGKPMIQSEFEALQVIWSSKLQKLEDKQRTLATSLINQILKKGFSNELTMDTTLYGTNFEE